MVVSQSPYFLISFFEATRLQFAQVEAGEEKLTKGSISITTGYRRGRGAVETLSGTTEARAPEKMLRGKGQGVVRKETKTKRGNKHRSTQTLGRQR